MVKNLKLTQDIILETIDLIDATISFHWIVIGLSLDCHWIVIGLLRASAKVAVRETLKKSVERTAKILNLAMVSFCE